jgi:hypothetical protein
MATEIEKLTSSDTHAILALLDGFSKIYGLEAEEAAKKNCESILGLLSEVGPDVSALIDYERKHAVRFNLFRDLKIASLEARVHTPFIANLLNPEGTHMQGRLFLDSFLVTMGIASNLSDAALWRVHSMDDELHLKDGFGIADIYMHLSKQDVSYYVIIENKIYAVDQKNQLINYFGYLKNKAKKSDQYIIYYLTPRDRKPEDDSIPSDELKLHAAACEYRNITYTRHINEWLSPFVAGLSLPSRVHYTIQQYLEIIKGF